MLKLAAELIRPAEQIDSGRIHHLSRLGGSGTGGSAGSDKPVVDNALDSILGMAVEIPALKMTRKELGPRLEGRLNQKINPLPRPEAESKAVPEAGGSGTPRQSLESVSDAIGPRQ